MKREHFEKRMDSLEKTMTKKMDNLEETVVKRMDSSEGTMLEGVDILKETIVEERHISEGDMDKRIKECLTAIVENNVENVEKRLRKLIAILAALLGGVIIVGLFDLSVDLKTNIQVTEPASSNGSEVAGTTEYYEDFINALFSVEEGTYYKDKNKNTFYSDRDCQQEIGKDVRFASYRSFTVKDSDGYSVACYLMDNGEICYCPGNAPVRLGL